MRNGALFGNVAHRELPLSLAVYLVLAVTFAAAADLTGRASVIDGDTIEIHGQRIRLFGIDAPEGRQFCEDAAGEAYRCGQVAALVTGPLRGIQVQC